MDEEDGEQLTIEVNCGGESGDEPRHLCYSQPLVRLPTSCSSVSLVRKPKLAKYQGTAEFREIVEYQHPAAGATTREVIRPRPGWGLGRSRKRHTPITSLQKVVTDLPELESKLKRPGPFQAASNDSSNKEENNIATRKVRKKRPFDCPAHDSSSTDSGDQSSSSNGPCKDSDRLRCDLCTMSLATPLELQLHSVAHHKHENAVQQLPLTCLEEGCTTSCDTLYRLKRHLSAGHDINFPTRTYTFPSFEVFSAWKLDVEAATSVRLLLFSSVSEVRGGDTRVYVCSNNGRYDHHFARMGRHTRRRRPRQKAKTGRACPAQLLVRSCGWGAVEVEASLLHYGHSLLGVPHGLSAKDRRHITSIAKETNNTVADDNIKTEDDICSVATTVEKVCQGYTVHQENEGCEDGEDPEEEDDEDGGVRIIEGSLLGHRGIHDLQQELAKWELYDNVSVCVCKRVDETDTSGLLQSSDFALGFATTEQLEAWSTHGRRAVSLLQFQGPPGLDYSASLTVVCVAAVSDKGQALPLSWLLTTNSSPQLLRHYFASLKMAFETLRGVAVPAPEVVLCEGGEDSSLLKTWREVFPSPGRLTLLVAAAHHNMWLGALSKIHSLSHRAQVYEEMLQCLRQDDAQRRNHDGSSSRRVNNQYNYIAGEEGLNYCEHVLTLLERLSQSDFSQSFASFMLNEYLPHVEHLRRTTTPITDESSNMMLYFDVNKHLISFLFVEDSLSLDYDECVSAVNRYTTTVLQENAEADGAALDRWRTVCASRHAEGLTLRGGGGVTAVGAQCWQVRDMLHGGAHYTVSRPHPLAPTLCSPHCKQVCVECVVCVHQYRCTCSDSTVLNTICAHTHQIRSTIRNPPTVLSTRGHCVSECGDRGHECGDRVIERGYRVNERGDRVNERVRKCDGEQHKLDSLQHSDVSTSVTRGRNISPQCFQPISDASGTVNNNNSSNVVVNSSGNADFHCKKPGKRRRTTPKNTSSLEVANSNRTNDNIINNDKHNNGSNNTNTQRDLADTNSILSKNGSFYPASSSTTSAKQNNRIVSSIQNKCLTILNLVKNRDWNGNCLNQCDQLLKVACDTLLKQDKIHDVLPMNPPTMAIINDMQTNYTCDKSITLCEGNCTTSDSTTPALSSGQLYYDPGVSGCSIDDLTETEGCIVLQEHDGKYSMVSDGTRPVLPAAGNSGRGLLFLTGEEDHDEAPPLQEDELLHHIAPTDISVSDR